MASRGIEAGGVVFLVVMLGMTWSGVTAQSVSGCTRALMGLSTCLNYVTGNSTTPSSSCCSQLAAVVGSQPQCLCSVLNGAGLSLGINVNQTLAMALPGVCNVQTPPISQCNAGNAPGPSTEADAPANSPSGSPELPTEPTTPSDTEIPSGAGGSKTVPSSTDGGSSSGNSIGGSSNLLAVVLLFTVLAAKSC